MQPSFSTLFPAPGFSDSQRSAVSPKVDRGGSSRGLHRLLAPPRWRVRHTSTQRWVPPGRRPVANPPPPPQGPRQQVPPRRHATPANRRIDAVSSNPNKAITPAHALAPHRTLQPSLSVWASPPPSTTSTDAFGSRPPTLRPAPHRTAPHPMVHRLGPHPAPSPLMLDILDSCR